jgi:predicted phage terminase large subunit-like protein
MTEEIQYTSYEKTKALLLGSFLTFIRTFFELKTGREFLMSDPIGRESHFITIARALRKTFDGDSQRLIINVPPGHSKSTMMIYFSAWALANHPDCNILYISYSYDLAEKHTAHIKEILNMPFYRKYFDTRISSEAKSRGNFMTTAGGRVVALGSMGSVMGQDAGLPGLDRFSGFICIDDPHKADECHSDTMRQKVITNYKETIKTRLRGPKVPIIFIGQRLHEDDLANYLISGADGTEWDKVILPALDPVENALYPENFPKAALLIEREFNPYVFAAQQMQNPQPAGGGIFKPDWIRVLDEEPEMLSTFISVDSAESERFTADFTVFSFFGLYKINYRGLDTGQYGLHWIDCHELRIEPKDIEEEFFQFYMSCNKHKVKPHAAIIEKKSSGSTLVSILKGLQGIRIIPVERARDYESGRPYTKIDRFLEMQPYVASGKITLPKYGKHNDSTLEHMRKITANNTHRHDDRADTLQQAIQCALIEGILLPSTSREEQNKVLDSMSGKLAKLNQLRRSAYEPGR